MSSKRTKLILISVFAVVIGTITSAVSADFMWGNLVLNRQAEKMSKAGVNPVIYPHWLHRVWFRCKVCHVDIVVDKLNGNNITMTKIKEGKVCGTCHNDKFAFGVENNCKRCHSLTPEGVPDGARYSADNIPDDEFKAISKKFGAKWNPEKMGKDSTGSRLLLPRDRFGFLDWIKMVEMGIVDPVYSLDPTEEDATRDTGILFNVLSDFEDNVLFSHNVHTYWMKCEMCHNKIFKDELGANKVRMKDMVIAQNYCIHCHGKVSFPVADCLRCHKREKGIPIVEKGESNILDRKEKANAVVVDDK